MKDRDKDKEEPKSHLQAKASTQQRFVEEPPVVSRYVSSVGPSAPVRERIAAQKAQEQARVKQKQDVANQMLERQAAEEAAAAAAAKEKATHGRSSKD